MSCFLISASAEENAPFSDTRLAVKYGLSSGFLYGSRTRLTPTCSRPTPADTHPTSGHFSRDEVVHPRSRHCFDSKSMLAWSGCRQRWRVSPALEGFAAHVRLTMTIVWT